MSRRNQDGGITRNPFLLRVSTTGTLAAGCQNASFANVGTADATVLGTVLKASESITFHASGLDDLGAIPYVATGTTLLILGAV
jgi:hypothetical protein